jgi:cytosine/adenosine deaminase-related metal-dependent hydrolase
MKTILKNGTVIAGKELEIKKADVLIEGQDIKEIADNIIDPDAKIIDVTGKLVMPGLVNAHLHSDENLLKGALDNLPLELWMLYAYPPKEYGPFIDRLIYLRTMLGAIEMLKSGVTLVQDDVSEYPVPTLHGIDAVMNAYKDIGLRASVTANLSDKAWTGKLPFIKDMLPEEISSQFVPAGNKFELCDYCEQVIKKWHGAEDRLNYVIAPSAPQRCTDDFMLMLNEISKKYNLPVHTHILETKMQFVTGNEFYATSLIKHLDDIGALSDRMTIIHSVWVSDEDAELMGKAGVSVAHNPASNLKLGSGIMPLRKLLDSGVNVAIGSDGMSSNDTQNIFEGMKLAALLHRVTNPDYNTWPTSREVFKMATQGGARSTLRHNETGTLEKGKKADIAILNMKTTAFTPLNDVINHLVYCENGSSVETVIVGGKVVVENGKITTINEELLLEELRGHMDKYWADYEKTKSFSKRIFPYVDEVYNKCVKTNTSVNRWTDYKKSWLK